jgi:hypothetical protein
MLRPTDGREHREHDPARAEHPSATPPRRIAIELAEELRHGRISSRRVALEATEHDVVNPGGTRVSAGGGRGGAWRAATYDASPEYANGDCP